MLTERGTSRSQSLLIFGLPTLALMLLGMAGYERLPDRRVERRAATGASPSRRLASAGSPTLGARLCWSSSNFYVPLHLLRLLGVGQPFRLMMASAMPR